jgi:3-hydroxyacyl-CoA dehydrogenase/enoyl-CoA hydratase/3-hydroxybutyryl-CoA epimerase/3-hydroxyacyl-CoA dehydrogenase/enoyl-CoA hydratase/3-hydroxybutyryl-CoA epimerase/enoyl-CoA isomerase
LTEPDRTRPSNPAERRALDNVRRLVEHNQADLVADSPADVRAIRSVGIVGAGMMGVSMAAAEVRQGVPVTITDADRRVLCHVPPRVVAELAAEMPAEQAQATVDRLLTLSIAPGPALRCDLVIESIVESFSAKHKLYSDSQSHLAADTILASNTSTIPIGRLATALHAPERFCGVHFCHPVRQRPLVEIVRGPKTSDATLAAVVAHIKAIHRMPIVVEDGPGFLINRLLLPYLSEALDLLLEGATIEAIEQTAVDFGMAMGPLRLLDEIGLDTTLLGGWTLVEAFPERIASSPLLVSMVKEGRLGRKAGKGFFEYPDANEPTGAAMPAPSTSPEVLALIAQWARSPEVHTPHSLTMRLLLPMLLEATRALDENKVRDPRDIDLGVIFGLGFPPTKGGLLWWADTFGPARLIEMLRPLERLGARAQPTPLLWRQKRASKRFYV